MKALYLALGRDLSSADAGTTHTLSITGALASLGVEVTLGVARPTGPAPAAPGVRLLEVERPGRLAGLAGALPEALAAAAQEADVVQERAEESGGIGVRLARATGKPLVLEINTPLSGHPSVAVRRLADANLRRQARAAGAIVTQTPISRTIIEGYSARPIFVIPNGVDPDVFRPDLAPTTIPGAGGRPVVAFAGSLRPWHGVEDLIEAGREVLHARGDAYFLFVGGGRREDDLKVAAHAALGEGNFYFAGAVAPPAVPGFLAAATVLVAPFSPQRDPVRRRQFERHGMWWSPVKIFEYMAMGRPIVASEAGAVPEYVAGAGLTFAPGDTRALAESLLRLLGDEELRARLGEEGRRKAVSSYAWRHAAERTVAAWRSVVVGPQKVSAIS